MIWSLAVPSVKRGLDVAESMPSQPFGNSHEQVFWTSVRYRQCDLHPAGGGTDLLTQGILKYIDPHMGVLRFARIGFPYPNFTAHFIGTFEISCGFLALLGLFTGLRVYRC
jgi:hypothetical protein